MTALLGLLLLLCAHAQAAPEIQYWETSNGAKVLFVAAPDLPMLDMRVVFHGGGARDGRKPGLAALTANMLTQGAGDWDANEIAERLESVGAKLGTGAQRDMAYATVRTLTRQPVLDTVLETMATVIAEPTFAEEDFERVRQNTLIGLRRDEQDPGTLGKKAVYRAIFGNHPYAENPSGTLESVAVLGREDLVAFHRRYYVARNAVIAMVGALSREEAQTVAEAVTAGLVAGEPAP